MFVISLNRFVLLHTIEKKVMLYKIKNVSVPLLHILQPSTLDYTEKIFFLCNRYQSEEV
jgi:hypothetical protein